MILISFMFVVYFLMLFMFSLISHPVYYCILLVMNSLICSFICYLFFGFSWYSLLFCLVYVGGVYILFVFVSVNSPNSSYVSCLNVNFFFLFLIFILLIFGGVFLYYSVLNIEFSAFLCTSMEGVFYVLICLSLLFGFFVLSIVMSMKLNFYR
uniref:NADH dehydrogenase subunit 6 n=1 Tax=Anoplocephala perfoliata TaxID=218192 RepID=A0A0N7DIE6_9CEST|nr:NADH dehydrogenase subunit 6 [Anoplocephala perfoliata]AKU46901.1 NADH dehydrogenase subunit 6 [Anoplocephala perfoliata]